MRSPDYELEEWRTRPMYTVGQAARLAGVSTITVKRWLYGAEAPDLKRRAVFASRERDKELDTEISFLALVEIVVASRFRQRGVPLERIRRAHEYARTAFKTDYPFADLRLRTDGVHILRQFDEAEHGASLLALDRLGQWTLPEMVTSVLVTFEYKGNVAARWFPVGPDVPIVIDPRYGAGVPTIPNRRLPVTTLYRRWRSGQDIKFIAEDFELEPSIVECALRYADRFAERRAA